MGPDAPETLTCTGPWDILSERTVALFCSRECPGAAILHTYDVVVTLRHRPITLISGYHSPMEKECMRALENGSARVIWCLPKALEAFSLPHAFTELYTTQRLLIISPFPSQITRITRETATRRNVVAAALADDVIVAYAKKDSATAALCTSLCDTDTHVCAIAIPENDHLIARGAHALSAQDVPSFWPDE